MAVSVRSPSVNAAIPPVQLTEQDDQEIINRDEVVHAGLGKAS